jgi:hypothetical protein
MNLKKLVNRNLITNFETFIGCISVIRNHEKSAVKWKNSLFFATRTNYGWFFVKFKSDKQ